LIGCNINAQDHRGHTAGHFIAMHNHLELLKYLVEKHNLDLSIRNHDDKLAIHCAAKHGSNHVLAYLFQLKSHINAIDLHGNTIAHEACQYNQIDCVKFLWKKARKLLVQENQLGRTCSHMV
jgi:ankyrin repeat protein